MGMFPEYTVSSMPASSQRADTDPWAAVYLAGSRKQVQLHIGIRQAIGVHGLQSLQKKEAAQDGQPQQGIASVAAVGTEQRDAVS